MIDARIPMMAGQAGQVNLVDMYTQMQQAKMNDQRMQMQQRQLDLQERAMLDQLDQRQKEAAAAGLKDMAAAVQWADTPEKWAQVQQHYAQFDPQLASVGFEQRESALLRLGQMSEYLDATKPSNDATSFGKDLAMLGIDPRSDEAKRIFYAKHSPAGYMLQPGGGSQEIPTVNSPDEARRLGPGAVFKTPDGRVMRVPGGAGSNASGGF